MATFRINQYEVWIQSYTVEAENKAQALAKVLDGDCEPDDNSLEYVETAEDRGIKLTDLSCSEEELEKAGCPIEYDYVPSIQSIEEISL